MGEGAEVELEIELAPDPVRLPGISVEVDRLPAFELHRATYTGLYMRRGDTRWATPGGSRVFVRADLEPHTGATVREFIERNAPSTIQNQLRNMRANERRSFLGQRQARGRAIGCDAPFYMIRGAEAHGLEIDMYLDMPIRDMEGIEFYRQGHHAPLELRHSKDDSATSCGVVVIWPRQVGELR